jgi:hypothetical protein
MFTPAQLLHNWHEQQPSNHGDLGSNVTGEARSVYYITVEPASDLISVLQNTTAVG